jgi:histidine triad (HIT) family protein
MLQLLKNKEIIMCLFCKIVKKEIPSNIILEDENFIAFHDINPKAPLHILAIPKIHVDSFDEVPAELMQGMTTFIQNIAKETRLNESGYRVITNIGENGGQEINHLHFHVLGGAKLKWDHFSDADPQGHF